MCCQAIDSHQNPSIAVAIPCYNEAVTIAEVVADFRSVLPGAVVHVFDNNSTDGSAALAEEAGAVVHYVPRQGKGNVMRSIFDSLAVDVLIVVDGDDTYHAEEVSALLQPILRDEADMAVGNRMERAADESLRVLHQVGNRLIVTGINWMFGSNCQDILSGYRAFGRRFVETVPLLTPGFETETELTVRALAEDMRIVEVPISYRSRPAGSESKLRSFQDGYRIVLAAAMLLRDLYPLRAFGIVSLVCLCAVLVAGVLRLLGYLGVMVPPESLLTGLILLFAPLGFLSVGIGLTLNSINTRSSEMKQIARRTKEHHV